MCCLLQVLSALDCINSLCKSVVVAWALVCDRLTIAQVSEGAPAGRWVGVLTTDVCVQAFEAARCDENYQMRK